MDGLRPQIKVTKKYYHCGKLGHFKRDHYDLKRKQKVHNNVELNNSASLDLNNLHVMTVSSEEVSKDWILYSGYTFHMNPIRSWFYNFIEIKPRKLYMGDNNSQIAIGIGDIVIKIHDRIIRPIRNVRYTPNLKRNLISLGIFEDEGHIFKFDDNTLKVMKGSLVVLKRPKRNGQYYLLGETVITQYPSYFTVAENKSEIWHNRMGHIGNKGLKYLIDQNYLEKI